MDWSCDLSSSKFWSFRILPAETCSASQTHKKVQILDLRKVASRHALKLSEESRKYGDYYDTQKIVTKKSFLTLFTHSTFKAQAYNDFVFLFAIAEECFLRENKFLSAPPPYNEFAFSLISVMTHTDRSHRVVSSPQLSYFHLIKLWHVPSRQYLGNFATPNLHQYLSVAVNFCAKMEIMMLTIVSVLCNR